jgi:hypothetical protein
VAQQAARLARATHRDRPSRARLLAAAWTHDIGHALGPGYPPLLAARALRRAGHEPLARLVAHRSGAAFEAALRGLPPLTREVPAPAGEDEALLALLDIADLTTGADGARFTPAARLRELAERRAPGDASIRVMVAVIARLGENPQLRALVEHVSPHAPA